MNDEQINIPNTEKTVSGSTKDTGEPNKSPEATEASTASLAEDSTKTAEDSTKAAEVSAAPLAEDSTKAAEDSAKTAELMWTKEDLGLQIRSFEHQISLIAKRNIEDTGKIKDLKESIVKLIKYFEENDLCHLERNVIDTKEKIYQVINEMTRRDKAIYFISFWGITPIGIAIIAMIISFYQIATSGFFTILGVPLWASLIAVAGTSVQILIGVANDYKDDCIITEYKRLWYIVLPFISFVFGFIAYLLTSVGLISIASGQMINNQSVNMSIVSAEVSSISPPAMYVIICFLAGYATDWFMGLLLKYTSKM